MRLAVSERASPKSSSLTSSWRRFPRFDSARRNDVVLVDVVQRLGDLVRDLRRLVDGELLLAVQHLDQLLALDELHHHEHADAIVLAEVDDRRDVRVR